MGTMMFILCHKCLHLKKAPTKRRAQQCKFPFLLSPCSPWSLNHGLRKLSPWLGIFSPNSSEASPYAQWRSGSQASFNPPVKCQLEGHYQQEELLEETTHFFQNKDHSACHKSSEMSSRCCILGLHRCFRCQTMNVGNIKHLCPTDVEM